MAALDFPANPTNGQVYGNYIYSTATGAWNAKPLTGQKTVVSATAPATPSLGDEWFNSNDGNLYVYYTDIDGSQWVQVKSDSTLSSTLGGRVDALENGAVNAIINGAFDVWQRGTSFTNPSYTADRWLLSYDGTGATRIITQQPHPAGETINAATGAKYFYRYNQSVAGSAGTYNVITQRIEDVQTFAGQTVTLSFYAKAAAAITLPSIAFDQNFGTGGSSDVRTTVTSSVSIGTSWNRYTYTFTLPSITGKTIGTNSFLQLEMYIPLNSVFTIDLFGIQAQVGSIATAFHRSAPTLQGELAACQRYYYRWTQTGTGATEATIALGIFVGANLARIYLTLPVRMRTTPVSAGQSNMFISDQTVYSATITAFSMDTSRSTPDTVHFTCTETAYSYPTRIPAALVAYATGAYVEVNAEL